MVQTLTCLDKIKVPNEKLTMITLCSEWVTLIATEFDSVGHHVKKGKRGACKQKAATVLPIRTAAT